MNIQQYIIVILYDYKYRVANLITREPAQRGQRRRNNMNIYDTNFTTFDEAINEAYEAFTLPEATTSYDGKTAFNCLGQRLYYYTQRSFNVVARYIQDGYGNNVYTYVDNQPRHEDYTGQTAFVDYLKQLKETEEKNVLKTAREILKQTGNSGGTYEMDEIDGPRHANNERGFYVAVWGVELDNPAFVELVEHLAMFKHLITNKYAKHITNNDETPTFLGYWIHNGTIFLDLTIHTTNKKRAIELGKEFKQLAIYDIENHTEIFLNK